MSDIIVDLHAMDQNDFLLLYYLFVEKFHCLSAGSGKYEDSIKSGN